MRFGRLVLELSPWLRQPDRNDDAVLPVALEIGRVQRLWRDFYRSVLLSLVPDAYGPRDGSEDTQTADA
jgi:hypothetical protein